jgi:dTDP-4-amino-4,6-dideoxygalactose transaminase
MLKTSYPKLAVFGYPPAFTEKILIGTPNQPDEAAFLAYLHTAFERRWLTNQGPLVLEFERRIAELCGVQHCLAVNNATIGLQIAARALGLSGEVIVPSFTFIATPHVLAWQGIRPVFADIDPQTHTLDPAQVEKCITPSTSGILPVHVWGRPCAIDELTEIARQHGLRLLFDAAHAFGCSYHGQMIGGFGDAEVFSFHATKFFNTFEGGAILTNDTALAESMASLRNFGYTGMDEVNYVGLNGKMSEASAAMGLSLLDRLDELVATNRRNYHLYRAGLAGIPGLKLIEIDESERHNYQYVVVEVDQHEAQISRDGLMKALEAENVYTRRYFYPGCHRTHVYRSGDPTGGCELPVTEQVAESVFALPTGAAVTPAAIKAICRLVRLIVEYAEAVSSRV